MKSAQFKAKRLLASNELCQILSLLPARPLRLTGHLELPVGLERNEGVWLEFRDQHTPELRFFDRWDEGRPYDREKQILGFTMNQLYERINFSDVGQAYDTSVHPFCLTVMMLRPCLMVWLNTGYRGKLSFTGSSEQQFEDVGWDFNFSQSDSSLVTVKCVSRYEERDEEKPEGSARALIASFADAARALPFLEEVPQPVLQV